MPLPWSLWVSGLKEKGMDRIACSLEIGQALWRDPIVTFLYLEAVRRSLTRL